MIMGFLYMTFETFEKKREPRVMTSFLLQENMIE